MIAPKHSRSKSKLELWQSCRDERSTKTAAGPRLVEMREGALESLNGQQAHTKLRDRTITYGAAVDRR
jgi:hypothetical protein